MKGGVYFERGVVSLGRGIGRGKQIFFDDNKYSFTKLCSGGGWRAAGPCTRLCS